MSLDYADYSSSGTNQTADININNARSFSVSWTSNQNMTGVRPPNPLFQKSPSVQYVVPQTKVYGPGDSIIYPVGLIQSNREPYAVDFTYGPYGNLNSNFGTNLGRN